MTDSHSEAAAIVLAGARRGAPLPGGLDHAGGAARPGPRRCARASGSASSAPPGSGKTTLLQILGGLDRPNAGRVEIDGRDLHALAETERGALRNRTIGFVYQFHHLLAEFSALENVAMPLLVRRMSAATHSGAPPRCSSAWAWASASSTDRTSSRAASGSAPRWRGPWSPAPRLVLADEPTGNLDGRNAEQVFALMLELNRELGTSLVIVTHDTRLAARMDRVLELENGVLR